MASAVLGEIWTLEGVHLGTICFMCHLTPFCMWWEWWVDPQEFLLLSLAWVFNYCHPSGSWSVYSHRLNRFRRVLPFIWGCVLRANEKGPWIFFFKGNVVKRAAVLMRECAYWWAWILRFELVSFPRGWYTGNEKRGQATSQSWASWIEASIEFY